MTPAITPTSKLPSSDQKRYTLILPNQNVVNAILTAADMLQLTRVERQRREGQCLFQKHPILMIFCLLNLRQRRRPRPPSFVRFLLTWPHLLNRSKPLIRGLRAFLLEILMMSLQRRFRIPAASLPTTMMIFGNNSIPNSTTYSVKT